MQEFPEPEDNVESYRKLLKSVLNVIGVSVASLNDKDENTISFVDPGYNDPREESQIRGYMKDK